MSHGDSPKERIANPRSPIGRSPKLSSPRLTKAQQWREIYRHSQSTIGAFHDAEDQLKPDTYNSVTQNLSPRLYQRRLQKRESIVKVDYDQAYARRPSVNRYGQTCELRLSGEVHRAKSFESSLYETVLPEIQHTSSPVSPYSAENKTKRIFPKTQTATNPSHSSTLLVTPSIEISPFYDDSDSSHCSESKLNLTPSPTTSQTTSPRKASQTVSPMPQHTDSPRADGSRRRRKLTRQPRSFQCGPDDQGGATLDEFEYFCQIANAPLGSKSAQGIKTETVSKRIRPPQPMRSHSMRTSGDEPDFPSEPRGTPQSRDKGRELDTEHTGSLFLRPPGRGQLRRASTEEAQLKHPEFDRKPVSAALSFSVIHPNTQNLSRTPPKFIPHLPEYPVSVDNPSAPIGLPLSLDSVIADEPGLTYYQVQVMGASGVGKTLLCQRLATLSGDQALTSDFDEDENSGNSHSVTTIFGEAVYTVNFVDSSEDNLEENLQIKVHDCIDAFVVLYAIDDSESFEAAKLILKALAPSPEMSLTIGSSRPTSSGTVYVPTPTYLVANKTDLVRARQVSPEDGKHLAASYGARFIELSASLNHLIAEFFINLVTYLRETEQKGRDPRLPPADRFKARHPSPLRSANKTQSMAGFRISASTKSSFSKFIKKHFTRVSDDTD